MYEPRGGFPPIIKKEQKAIKEKTLDSRGIGNTFVNIAKILDNKNKENDFIPFINTGGTTESDKRIRK